MSEVYVYGHPTITLDTNVYAVSFPDRISQQAVETLKREWTKVMPAARLIVLDAGAQITPLVGPEPTPIYDALVAERQAS